MRRIPPASVRVWVSVWWAQVWAQVWARRQVLDGALVLLGLEVVDGHLLEGVHGGLDDRLREEQHLLRVVCAPTVDARA